MTTETIETPATPADPEPVEPQTEKPVTEPVVEPAAEPTEPAAAPQVEVEKPDYVTREELEAERRRAGDEALERDRRRRQTEGARLAKAEKEEREAAQETADVIRASLVSQGLDPSILTDEAVTRTIDRVARKRADRISSRSLDTVDEAWDYLTAPAYGKSVEPDDSFADAANRIGPKLQHFVDTIRPAIEAKAREGYIAESELPKRVDDEIARRAAAGRKGQEDLTRVEGKVPDTTDRSLMAVANRIISSTADDEDRRIFRSSGYSLNNRS